MRTGKISESILKRSVLRLIKTHRDEVIKGAEVGGDCAFLSWRNQERGTACSMQTVTLPVKNAAYLAVIAGTNNLTASGAEPAAVLLSLTLPEEAPEEILKEIMNQAQKGCTELNIQIAGGHTEVSSAVRSPVISVTAVGTIGDTACMEQGDASEMDIVMSKWIGLEGTAVLALEKGEELAGRFPARLIDKAKSCEGWLSTANEAAIALKSGVYTMHDIRNGGVFGALWELSRKIGVGLTVHLREIPIRQETVEICEFFDLNPYELLSGGALLMVTSDGKRLAEDLQREGVPAAVIGRTNSGNDKVVLNRDETRYLTMPAADEIFKVSF
ncbi:MAG: AIR synthase related protein [Lachnospiraceae bacterium]|nr:AIR synthase related protein [Lachnospiraceae bacterium]